MKNIAFLLFLSIAGFCHAQSYENLVLEGGGIKGIAFGGALEVLDSLEMLWEIKNIAGTSSGGITACLLAIGYRPQEITKIIATTNFGKFNDGGGWFIGGIRRTKRQFGWYKGDRFLQFLEQLFADKIGNKNLTFSQLRAHAQTNAQYKNLWITGTNLTEQRAEIFSAETYPNMRIVDAVRVSMSIPMYYRAPLVDSEGGLHWKQNEKSTYCVMVDGGILANYPIHIFDEAHTINSKTLGIRLDDGFQFPLDVAGKRQYARRSIHDFSTFMEAFYKLMNEELNRKDLSEEDWLRTISINTENLGPKVKKMKPEEVDILVNNGKKGALKFFEKYILSEK